MDDFRYSAIETAHKCLKKYELQYILKKEIDGLDSLDLEFGSAMHLAIQAMLEGDGAPENVFRIYWESIRDIPMEQSRMGWDALLEAGTGFITRFQRLHAKKFVPFKIEHTLQGTIGGFGFHGTPDFLGLYEGVPSVVDFKTSNKEYPKDKILVNEQMPGYAYLAKQQLDYTVEQMVYKIFIKPEGRIQTVVIPLTKTLLDNTIKNVILMCDDLSKRKEYPKNPGSCVMGAWKCPYFNTCHKGGESGST